MKDFEYYIDQVGEIGVVAEIHHSIVYVSGLPKIKPHEVVLFETGEIGQVLSIDQKYVEILLFSDTNVRVGTRVCRTDSALNIGVSETLLGKVIDPLGRSLMGGAATRVKELHPIEARPLGITDRKNVDSFFETGVSLVDILIPLGKGQRELVIGDRKTGKTQLLFQIALNQTKTGVICVYAAIAKRRIELRQYIDFFSKKGILKNMVVVNSYSSDPGGLIFLTPYTAMTIAEFFRNMGKDVLVIFDDMTTHAKFYREISLLAKRFPGRSAYPGDIFYIHARLMERGGNFKKGSITCLPVAETVMGEISGYIQTNLMSMTDGHIYFDTNLFNQGKRPAINPFLSVTRVGMQTQSVLVRDLSRQLSSFMINIQRLKQFMHFGAELTESVRQTLALGERVENFFQQAYGETNPLLVTVLIIASLWAGHWKDEQSEVMKKQARAVVEKYLTDNTYKKEVDDFVQKRANLKELVSEIGSNTQLVTKAYRQTHG